jgi:hypothetical protein
MKDSMFAPPLPPARFSPRGKRSMLPRVLVASFLALLQATPCAADESGQWVEQAAGGRYDQLEKTMEGLAARRALDTAERHALCFAYAKLKRYAPLFECLDALAEASARAIPKPCCLDSKTPRRSSTSCAPMP